VAGVGTEERPARGIDGGRRRLPRRLGGSAGLGNTRPREVHWGLVKLGEWSAGGERERGRDLKAAAMAGGSSVARGGEEEGAYIGRLGVRG
jgi:hypothetical protein